jgi:NAD(P)-dependent dehydrogenase (short-subunit alcohol dehydrogenase family)
MTRTAIITGAAQGVGEATAHQLASQGFGRFLLIDRSADRLGQAADRLRATGAEVHQMVTDLADIAATRAALAPHLTALGTVDALINAAGSTARGGIKDATVPVFDLLFAVNVRAPFFLIQDVAPHMPRGGVIVNVASMLAHGGPAFLAAYAASKGALVTLTKTAANTLKADGLRVLAINLGWTVTPSEHDVQTRLHGLPEDWADQMGRNQPFRRLLTAEDPAALIGFLASPGAAMMTGAIIDLDQHVNGTMEHVPGTG